MGGDGVLFLTYLFTHIYLLQDAKTRVGETISLPRVVFPSNEVEEVGLLNKAAPR